MTFDPHAKAYLSILGWPSGFTHDDRIEALVASAAMDPRQAALQSKIPTPAIVTTIDALISDEILRVLHKRGVLALAPSEDEIALYPKPEPVKRIARFPNTTPPNSPTSPTSFAVDDNDEPAWTFTSQDIRLVVAATTQSSSTTIKATRPIGGIRKAGRRIPEARITKSHQLQTNEILDLHLWTDGKPRLLRLTGQRTLIRSLENIDKPPSLLDPPDPIELLKPHIPGVHIDQGFNNFTPPANIRIKGEGSRAHNTKRSQKSFEFYSVWVALLDQMLRG